MPLVSPRVISSLPVVSIPEIPWEPVYYSLLGSSGDSTPSYPQPVTQPTYHSSPQFKPDGTAYYVVDPINVLVQQYELMTPWEINTARTYGKFIAIASLGTGGSGWRNVRISPDGLSLYLMTSTRVYKCSLATAWDITTATWLGGEFILPTNNSALDARFNSDGTKMFTTVDTGDAVQSYTLSTAYDITTATYDSVSFPVGFGELIPRGLNFNNTGTRMYIIGDNNRLTRYALSTPWDISTASFDNYFFNTAYLTSLSPSDYMGFDFSPDGTSMYLAAYSGGVRQLRMSVPYDISTITYKRGQIFTEEWPDSFNVPNAKGVRFNATGTKAYFMNEDATAQYSVATPYDLSTMTFDKKLGNTYESGGVTREPDYFAMSADGSKLYTSTSSTVFENVLLEPWNIESLYYNNVSFSTSAQTSTNTRGLTFSTDGTKMYTMRTGSSYAVFQYTLSTPWNLATASYAGVTVSIAAQTSNPYGLSFAMGGTKMYVVSLGFPNQFVYQYTLSTPWVVSSATYDGVAFAAGPAASLDTPRNLLVTDDGAKMYVTAYSLDPYSPPNTDFFIHQFTIGTPGNVSTAVYDNFKSNGFNVIMHPTIFYVNPTGTSYYTVNIDRIYKVDMSVPWDIDTGVPASNMYMGVYYFRNGEVSSAGNRMFLLDSTTKAVLQYNLSIPNDPMSAVYDDQKILTETANPQTLSFSGDGKFIYVTSVSGTNTYVYTLSTAWDITTAVYSSTQGGALGYEFLDSGRVALVRSSGGILRYPLNVPNDYFGSTDRILQSSYSTSGSTGWSSPFLVPPEQDGELIYITSTESIQQLEVIEGKAIAPWELVPYEFEITGLSTGFTAAFHGIRFNSTGTKMFLQTLTTIREYNLSTPWDANTGVLGNILTTSTEQTSARGLFFKPDGTALYICGTTSSNIHMYNLGTAWDISTAVYSGDVASFTTNSSAPADLYISPTGTKLFIVSSGATRIAQYTLGTPWNITTATYDTVLHTPTYVFTSISGFTWDPTGTMLFVSGARSLQPDRVVAFRVSTPWTLTGIKAMGFTLIRQLTTSVAGTGSVEIDPTGRKLYVPSTSTSGTYVGFVLTFSIGPPGA